MKQPLLAGDPRAFSFNTVIMGREEFLCCRILFFEPFPTRKKLVVHNQHNLVPFFASGLSVSSSSSTIIFRVKLRLNRGRGPRDLLQLPMPN